MPKKLIVCADGTWNDEDRTRTNVAKLHRALKTWHVEGVDQWVCYVSGVGTTFGEAISGGAFGYGLSRNVLQGYYFLVDNYQLGDQLYFFGFSRGAYTVRSLAGFIRNSGLLKKEHRDRIDEAWKLYRSRSKNTGPRGNVAQQFRAMYSYEPVIIFIGVWDTVGSLGIPSGSLRLLGLLFNLFGYDWRFHDPQLSTKVKHAYHALSIHERRSTFVPTLWEKQQDAPPDQVLEQMWFPGVHCDVGGGYNAAGLSDEALDWMMEKAEKCGLVFRAESRHFGLDNAPDPFGRLHDSYSLAFRFIDFILRKFKGEPRIYSNDPKYCADLSPSALMLRHFSTKQEWPSTFVRALDLKLAKINLDNLRLALKPPPSGQANKSELESALDQISDSSKSAGL
jgi:type VI secretion system (T6SS) phospholipase Tle1-like effector